jgi:CheY-like chemotaxis protein
VSEDEGQATFLFSVEDTGMGIPEQQQQYIFEKFTQVDSSAKRKFEGTGLGLAISSELVKLMGGLLNVKSSKGNGSIFYFDIKLPLAEKMIYKTNDYSSLRKAKVMLVENNPMIVEFLGEYMFSWGVAYSSAPGIEEAVDIMRKLPEEEVPFNTIIIDQRSGTKTPEEIAGILKCYKNFQDMKMMLLLPLGKKYNSAALKEAGYSAIITKPLRPSEVFDNLYESSLESNLKETGTLPEALPIERRAQEHRSFTQFDAKILLAEDSTINQRTATAIFKKFGCDIDVASNGAEAVEMFSSQKYDIIFMDCQMPEKDGYEATKLIRKGKNGKKIPIIAMTANAMSEDRTKCLHVGMNDYIAKPVSMDELEIILFRYSKKADGAATVPKIDYNNRATTIRNINIVINTTDILDPEKAISAAAYDINLMQDLIEIFTKDIPLQIEAVIKSVDKKDFETVVRLCHKLRGSIGTIGGISLAALAHQTENAAQNQDIERCREKANTLQDEFAKLQNALNNCNWNEYVK